MARACARRTDRARVSKSIQRDFTQPHHRGESESSIPPWAWPRSWLGIETVTGEKNARRGQPAEYGARRPLGECHRESLGRAASSSYTAHGHLAASRTAAVG